MEITSIPLGWNIVVSPFVWTLIQIGAVGVLVIWFVQLCRGIAECEREFRKAEIDLSAAEARLSKEARSEASLAEHSGPRRDRAKETQ